MTDGMVDGLGVAGTPATARGRLRDLVAGTVVDHPILVAPRGADAETVDRTVETLAPGTGTGEEAPGRPTEDEGS